MVLSFITYNSFYWEGAKQPEMMPKNKKKQLFCITKSQCRLFISCFKGVEYLFHSLSMIHVQQIDKVLKTKLLLTTLVFWRGEKTVLDAIFAMIVDMVKIN